SPSPAHRYPPSYPTRLSSDLPVLPAGLSCQRQIYHIDRLSCQKCPQILHRRIHEPLTALPRRPGDMRRDETVFHPEERIVLRHRSEEHTSELQSRFDLVCRLL